jgi:hypothetical protein
MKRLIITLSVLVLTATAMAQEHLPRQEALKYAFLVSVDLKNLQGTPIPTDVDVKRAVAMRDGDYGALVLPEAKLSVTAVANAGASVVPLGQLWLHRLTPMKDGSGIPEDSLRLVTVEAGQETGTAVQCALGVKGNGSGGLELLLYGKGQEPVLSVPLRQAESSNDAPISMDAERTGDEGGRIILRILGRYRASIPVTELGF